jgi:hypothetical protein
MKFTLTNPECVPEGLPRGTYCTRLVSASWAEMKFRFVVPGRVHVAGDCLVQLKVSDKDLHGALQRWESDSGP